MQFSISVIFILLLGIPHGAIDHVLYTNNSAIRPIKFYSVYLLAIVTNVILWLIAPLFALFVFIIISAYHFGQSQFDEYFIKSDWSAKLLFLSWGCVVLFTLFYFHLDELRHMFAQMDDTAFFLTFMSKKVIYPILLASTILLIISGAIQIVKTGLPFEVFMLEVFILGCIVFCNRVLPILIAFTLFFVIIHSVKVLKQEFGYLYRLKQKDSALNFLKQLLPYTLVSVIGTMVIFLLIKSDIIPISFPLMFIILISAVTFPHSIVMHKFYDVTKD